MSKKKDVPADVLDILDFMINKSDTLQCYVKKMLPNIPLFTEEESRWRWMLQMDSMMFPEETISTLKYNAIADQFILCIRCNLKNYTKEIERFVEWIDPYLDEESGSFLGFSRFETTQTPTLIYKK